MSCGGRMRRRVRSRSSAHTHRLTATWRSPTRALSRTSIRPTITREKCSTTAPAIVHAIEWMVDSPGEFRILTAALTHLGFGVPFGNQPRANARRHIAYVAAMEVVQLDPVELRLARRFNDSNFHLVSKWSKRDAVVNARAYTRNCKLIGELPHSHERSGVAGDGGAVISQRKRRA